MVKNLSDMQKGEILEVTTNKFEAIENDIGAWTRMTGFILEGMETGTTYQKYYIRNAGN
jgi:TusA-related sulfurtransferase